jgi:hypothetical protein
MREDMNTKILVGSIGAVVILILVSFTTVVGVQSTPSGSMNISPLFEYRTKNAIKKTQDVFHSRYIGMGDGINIPLSGKDERVKLVLTFIENIIQMDENTFSTLLVYCINHLTKDSTFKNTNIAEIISGLRNLRKNPESILSQITNTSSGSNNNYEIRPQQYTVTGSWIPGCLLAAIFYMLFIYPIIVTFFLITAWRNCLQSIGTNCNNCPCYRVQVNKYLYDLDIL